MRLYLHSVHVVFILLNITFEGIFNFESECIMILDGQSITLLANFVGNINLISILTPFSNNGVCGNCDGLLNILWVKHFFGIGWSQLRHHV